LECVKLTETPKTQ